MGKRLDIIGIGDADCDIQLEVDHFPQHDEKVKARVIGKYPGGIISNFLCAASLFGAKCGAVVRVGDDSYGHQALEDLQRRGIETQNCVINPQDSTYFCVTSLDKTGEKSMLVCMSNPTQPEAKDIQLDYLSEAAYVHMIGTYPELVLPVARQSAKRGYRISLDIEAQTKTISREEIEEICSLCYIAFPNRSGLDYFTGCKSDIEKGAQAMLAMGTRIVVVTLGAQGVLVCTDKERIHLPAFQVEVRDTTGAGDTFNASFLASYLRGHSLKECALLATAASACQIQKIGAREGMIDYDTAVGFLEKQGIEMRKL